MQADRNHPYDRSAQDTLRVVSTVTLLKGWGADAFDVRGPAWQPDEVEHAVSRARSILIERGYADGIDMFQSVSFAVYPAGNMFGDDFHVLCGDTIFPDYTTLTTMSKDKKWGAFSRFERVIESKWTGPATAVAHQLKLAGRHIRIVAIRVLVPREVAPEIWLS